MIDDIIAHHLGAPWDARLGLDFEVLKGDLPLLAHPGCGRGEHFEVRYRVDGPRLNGEAACGEVVVKPKLRIADLEQAVELLIELRLLRIDLGVDLDAQGLLRVGDALLVRVERGAVVLEKLVERARLRDLAQFDEP